MAKMAPHQVVDVDAYEEMKAYFSGNEQSGIGTGTREDVIREFGQYYGALLERGSGGDLVALVQWYNCNCNPFDRAIPLPSYKRCSCGYEFVNAALPPFSDSICRWCETKPCRCCDTCLACGTTVCRRGQDGDINTCAYLCCADCNKNPVESLCYKPCQFGCNSHMFSSYHHEHLVGDASNSTGWRSAGVVCRECYMHKLYVAERSVGSLKYLELCKHTCDGAIARSLGKALLDSKSPNRWRKIVYLSDDKLRYFLRCTDFCKRWAQALQTQITSQALLLGVDRIGTEGIEQEISRCLCDALDSLGPTPTIRPWMTLKILARLVIIFRRYLGQGDSFEAQ